MLAERNAGAGIYTVTSILPMELQSLRASAITTGMQDFSLQHLFAVALVSRIHMNKEGLVTSWQKPCQSAKAKCPPRVELLILQKGFEFTNPGLYLSFYWTTVVCFPLIAGKSRCVLHHQNFLHADHQWASTGLNHQWARTGWRVRTFLIAWSNKMCCCCCQLSQTPETNGF